jgi:pimeloyl-ACP methyl ester carboxylesterase
MSNPRSAAVATALLLTLTACSDGPRAATTTTDEANVPSAPDASSSTSTSSASATSDESTSTNLIMDVELDGRRIHVTCFGPTDATVPTILFEAGGGSPSDTWDVVVDSLSTTRRTCAYDRAGTGASPLPPDPRRTMKDVVADLEAVLATAEIDGPFVLVGHSMAVWPESVYAAAHPEDVAGVVLVDPRAPHISDRFRTALAPRRAGEPEAVTIWREEDLGAFEHDPSLNPEHLDLTMSAAQASRVLDAPGPLFGDVPMIVLSASDSDVPFSDLPPRIVERFHSIWVEEQRALAEESTNGTFLVVPDTTHEIQIEQPQAVIDAIESVAAAASSSSSSS